MKQYFLYKLTFPNNKVYIGQTVNFKKKGKEYLSVPKSVGGFKWSYSKVLTIA